MHNSCAVGLWGILYAKLLWPLFLYSCRHLQVFQFIGIRCDAVVLFLGCAVIGVINSFVVICSSSGSLVYNLEHHKSKYNSNKSGSNNRCHKLLVYCYEK